MRLWGSTTTKGSVWKSGSVRFFDLQGQRPGPRPVLRSPGFAKDRTGLMWTGLLQFSSVARPVETSYSLNRLETGLRPVSTGIRCNSIYTAWRNYTTSTSSIPNPVFSQAKHSTSSSNISSNAKSTSSTCKEDHVAISWTSGRHVEPIITNSSKTAEPRHACCSVAIYLLPEKTHSHGTDEAWEGRMSSAIQASIENSIAWSYEMIVCKQGNDNSK